MPKKIIIPSIILIVVLAAFIVFNLTSVQDWLRGLNYEPSTAVVIARDNLSLTDSADVIFNSARPAIESATAFNQHCTEGDEETAVLGCYNNGQIYVYEINSSELVGITESTLAHEFLHAAWERLSSSEKASISTELEATYRQHYAELADALSVYDESEQLDELHSRVGTQIADLPDSLETYYARYFDDQDAVVAYYNSYSATFNQLQSELETLERELDSLSAQIQTDTDAYVSRSNQLTTNIADFNNCANTAGCFDQATFNSRRDELLTEQAALSNLYQSIVANTDLYNQKIIIYNQNLLHTQDLQNLINSNSEPPEV